MSLTIFFVGLLLLNSVMWFCGLVLPYDFGNPIFVLGMCLYGWLLATVLLRSAKEFDLIQSQLQNFSFTEASCCCCSMGHRGPGGERIICDRDIMRKCIQDWFGSVQGFEDLVQTRVKEALTLQLGGNFCPFPLLVAASLPLFWSQQDSASSWALQQHTDVALAIITLGLAGITMLGASTVGLILISISCVSRYRSTLLQKLVGSVVSMVAAVSHQLWIQICNDRFGTLPGALTFAASELIPSVLIWWAARRFFSLRSLQS